MCLEEFRTEFDKIKDKDSKDVWEDVLSDKEKDDMQKLLSYMNQNVLDKILEEFRKSENF